ncbi:MAG: phospho-sugar mutase [Opitutales bacterium]
MAAAERLAAWRAGGFLPAWAVAALDELAAAGAWDELEDRFFRDLSFGTGGMRGRTIGRRPAPAELGPGGLSAPAHPAIGANTLNDVTVARATCGLFRQAQLSRPRLVIAHDVRHFSRRFAELAARIWSSLGGEAHLFAGPRSTPQLSFTVRALGADAGIVLTASHNPPHDNGYKVYAADGGQLVPAQADRVVEAARAVALADLGPLLQSASVSGAWQVVSPAVEEQYFAAVMEVPLDASLIRERRPRVVYSALHGTGGVVIPRVLKQLGAEVIEVTAQAGADPNFSGLSPNPEDPHALDSALSRARAENADLALVTDPDADRIGVAFRGRSGSYEPLNGNELGVLLADFRLRRAKELGWLPPAGSPRAAILKTFVTTPLLDTLARAHGVRCVNTLTGFKWMGAKLNRYDQELAAALAAADDRPGLAVVAALPPRERAALRLRHATWVVFAAEESYGCLAGDAVRDKDANAAAALCAELAAWLSRNGQTAAEVLGELHVKFGYHFESLRSLNFEGAAGAAQIKRVLAALHARPPSVLGGRAVVAVGDFLQPGRRDEDGEAVPLEDFLLYELAGGWRCAIRGSGTEPKLKLYFFVREPVANLASLPGVRAAVQRDFPAWRERVVKEIFDYAGPA